jgi:hypothetical protein
MTLLSEQCGYVLRGLIVSREGFERNDGCEVLQEKLSQWWGSPHATVVDFVTAKAPNFNKIQQCSTSRPQTIQQESLRINRIP